MLSIVSLISLIHVLSIFLTLLLHISFESCKKTTFCLTIYLFGRKQIRELSLNYYLLIITWRAAYNTAWLAPLSYKRLMLVMHEFKPHQKLNQETCNGYVIERWLNNMHLLTPRFINGLCFITINTLTDVKMTVGGAYLRQWITGPGKEVMFWSIWTMVACVYNTVRTNSFFRVPRRPHYNGVTVYTWFSVSYKSLKARWSNALMVLEYDFLYFSGNVLLQI